MARWGRLVDPVRELWTNQRARSEGARYAVTVLASQFLSPIEAEGLGELVGLVVQNAHHPPAEMPMVACISPVVDPAVAAGFFVYRLVPTQRADGVWTTADATPEAAPHWFPQRYLAHLFAQQTWNAQLIELHDGHDPRDAAAWGSWCPRSPPPDLAP